MSRMECGGIHSHNCEEKSSHKCALSLEEPENFTVVYTYTLLRTRLLMATTQWCHKLTCYIEMNVYVYVALRTATPVCVCAAASTVRDTMQRIDRFEVSLLVRPVAGLTADPDRLTELIKKIGGFRIGSLPDFRAAHDTGDFVGALRRLAPYAGTILATVGKSGPGGKVASGKADKTPFDLVEGLEAVLAVGYQHAICLDHVGGPNAANTIVESRARIEAALAPEEEPSSDDVAVGEDG